MPPHEMAAAIISAPCSDAMIQTLKGMGWNGHRIHFYIVCSELKGGILFVVKYMKLAFECLFQV